MTLKSHEPARSARPTAAVAGERLRSPVTVAAPRQTDLVPHTALLLPSSCEERFQRLFPPAEMDVTDAAQSGRVEDEGAVAFLMA